MDEFDFGFDSADFGTNAINFGFGKGGRINRLWIIDTESVTGGDQQFVSSPIPLGDETSDEYYPGTILLGVRTDPEDPWMVSRNEAAEQTTTEDGPVHFRYDFPLISEVQVEADFLESPLSPNSIIWRITITNTSRNSVEIGELGFPFALHNSYEGYPTNDDGVMALVNERVFSEINLGGFSTYLLVRKLSGEAPALAVFSSGSKPIEFFHYAPLSLSANAQWEGIPILYFHSLATVDREEWPDSVYEHTSVILEPRESRTYELTFAALTQRHERNYPLALTQQRVPAIFPNTQSVFPVGTPASFEIIGARAASINISEPGELIESETDDSGGFLVIEAKSPGPIVIEMVDMDDRTSRTTALAIQPVSELIQARADWIFKNQIASEGSYQHAILPASFGEGEEVTLAKLENSWELAGSLADATFLAEKNCTFLELEQVEVLDNYVEKFLLKRIQKPSQGVIGAILADWADSVAVDGSRSQLYVHVARLYLSLAKLRQSCDLTRTADEYTDLAKKTIRALQQFADRETYETQTLTNTRALEDLPEWVEFRKECLASTKFPFWNGSLFAIDRTEEASRLATASRNLALCSLVDQLLIHHKSLSPNWWCYGIEPRAVTDFEGHPAFEDFGKVYPSVSAFQTSAALTRWLEQDYAKIDESALRLGIGGMLMPWSLVREDGAAACGYCPDLGSRNRGVVAYTGDIGFLLADHLAFSTCYLLSTPDRGFIGYGLNFDSFQENGASVMRLQPYDGVGRRVVVRHLNLEILVTGGRIDTLEFDINLSWVRVTIDNPVAAASREATLTVRGLWGTNLQFEEATAVNEDTCKTKVPAGSVKLVTVRV